MGLGVHKSSLKRKLNTRTTRTMKHAMNNAANPLYGYKPSRKKPSLISSIIVGAIFICALSFIASWLFPILICLFIGYIILRIAGGSNGRSHKDENNVIANKKIQSKTNNLNECIHVMNTSINLETVIDQYNNSLKILAYLTKYEDHLSTSFARELPSAMLLRLQNEKHVVINAAIRRAYEDMIHKSSLLKTDKERKRFQSRFFDELDHLSDLFPSETQAFINEINKLRVNSSTAGLGEVL